jgi:hypothetical protein
MAGRRPTAVAKERNDPERITLAPLTFAQAVRGLFSVNPDKGDEKEQEADHGDRS